MNQNPIVTTNNFETVYQVDITDRVLGGESGAINVQAKQLANRDFYLLNRINNIPIRPNFVKITSHSSQPLTQITTTTSSTTFSLSGFAGTGLYTNRITSLKVLCSLMADSGGSGVCTITATAGTETIKIFGNILAAPNNDSFGASALIDVPINDGQTSTTISIDFSGYWQGQTASTEIVGAIQQ